MPSQLEPVVRDALAWVIRLHSGAATTADGEALQEWRQRDPRHEDAFRTAVRLWRTFGEGVRALEVPAETSRLRFTMPRSTDAIISRRGLIGAAFAASTVGYFCVNPPFDLWPSLSELSADYRTTKGEQRAVVLSKDLSLRLNTETSINLHPTQGLPQIELISGEAAIDARIEDGQRPVVVLAAGGRVTASQAKFDACCLDRVVSISCLEGVVDVKLGDRSAHLSKGQQLSYSAADGLGAPEVGDPIKMTAWQDGLIVVRNQSLASAVDEVNRYRQGRIIILSDSLARRNITGTFHLGQLDDFVAQVRELFGATARYLPGNIVLLS
jgi:transmembrane sensor